MPLGGYRGATSRIPQLQRRCSCHRQSCRATYRPLAKPASADWPTKKPAIHNPVCRLMVSSPVSHVITWNTTHLP